jgi:hypothetical protein
MQRTQSSDSPLNQLQLRAFLVALAGTVLSVLLAALNPTNLFSSYLIAFLYWTEISLGCLGFLLLINLVQGTWGAVVQRIMAAGARTLLLMAVLFVPLILGLQRLYPWAAGHTFDGVELHQPISYLTIPFFLIRALIFFLIWVALAYLLSQWSYDNDATSRSAFSPGTIRLSGLGIVLFVITVSLAAFDWSMSLDPLWFSSIYGWLAIGRQGLMALALAVIVLALLKDTPPVAQVLTQRLVNDLGNLLLAAILLWTYMHFFQYLIMWYGNLPRDMRWFVPRLADGWGLAVLALLLFHFFLPFLFLIIPTPKRTIGRLAAIGGVLLVMHLVELHWLVRPGLTPTPPVNWLDLTLPITIGSLWLAMFLWTLRGQRLLPANHPLLQTPSHPHKHHAHETPRLAS